MPGKNNKIISVGGQGNPFQGVMLNISPKDLPPHIFQKLINLEPAEKIGSLKKRNRYGQIFDNLGTYSDIKEYVDKDEVRELLGLKDIDLYSSAYNYEDAEYLNFQQITGQSNDKRISLGPVQSLNPVIYDKIFRSGAGIGTNDSNPLWYANIAEQLRFPDGATRYGEPYGLHETTIPAGKYLCDQLLQRDILGGHGLEDGMVWIECSTTTCYKTDFGLNYGFAATDQKYIYVYVVPVFDGYQYGFLSNYYTVFPYGRLAQAVKIPYSATMYNLKIRVQIHNNKTSVIPRLTHLALFVSTLQDDNTFKQSTENYKIYPAYFLEKIPLTGDTDTIVTKTGTFEAANPPTYITFADNFADWETFNLTGFYAQIPNGTSFKLGARTTSTTFVRYAVSGVPNSYNGDSYDFEIKSKWATDISTHQSIYTIYDNFNRKLGAYFFEHAGIPEGDMGLDDVKYRYACEAGRRYFIFGRTDGWGYFSLANKPDVIPALNVIRPKFLETGCVGVDKDVLLFGKFKTSRIQVLSNENAVQDDEFLDVGCANYKSIVKLNENVIAWMSYNGPYIYSGREAKPIGEVLNTWWLDTLTDSQKEACVAGFNYKRQQIWFSFPTYTDSDFPYGIIFVFDMKSYQANFTTAWYYFRSDITLKSMDLNDDGHLIGIGSKDDIYDDYLVDWDSASPQETCDWLIKFAVLENQLFGKRCRNNFKKLFIDYETSDTIAAQIYLDGSATPVTLTIDANREAFIRYLAETLELEILGSVSINDAEIKKVQLMFTEKRF